MRELDLALRIRITALAMERDALQSGYNRGLGRDDAHLSQAVGAYDFW
jgi:hypothetical protein